MKQNAPKRKPATKPRATVRRQAAAKTGSRRRNSEAALATLWALLHADRWLFEATELAKKGKLSRESEAFDRIRLEIVASLNRLQPQAYGAMTLGGQVGGK